MIFILLFLMLGIDLFTFIRVYNLFGNMFHAIVNYFIGSRPN